MIQVTPKTQQLLVLIGFCTICGLTVLAFGAMAIYATIHDGQFGDQFMQALEGAVQWGIAAIGTVLGVHTVMQKGMMGQPPVPAPAAPPTAVPPDPTPADGPVSGS